MVWFLAIVGITAAFSLLAATVWGAREIFRATTARRLERRLNPQDVVELDRAFARVLRDVLLGD